MQSNTFTTIFKSLSRGWKSSRSFMFIFCRLFSIDDSGEISVNDLSTVNSSTVHLVAVATDSGLPPRQVSALSRTISA